MNSIAKTYSYLSLMILVTSVTAVVGVNTAPVGAKQLPYMVDLVVTHPVASVLGFMGAAFVTSWLVSCEKVFAPLVALVFPLITGFFLGPAIYVANRAATGAVSGNPVRDAFLLTLGVMVSLTIYVFWSKKDFSFLWAGLFSSLVTLVIASFMAIFLGSAIFSLGIAVAGVVVFVGFVLYDTSKVMRGEGTPLQNALSLYLDFVNLFVDLLRILSQKD